MNINICQGRNPKNPRRWWITTTWVLGTIYMGFRGDRRVRGDRSVEEIVKTTHLAKQWIKESIIWTAKKERIASYNKRLWTQMYHKDCIRFTGGRNIGRHEVKGGGSDPWWLLLLLQTHCSKRRLYCGWSWMDRASKKWLFLTAPAIIWFKRKKFRLSMHLFWTIWLGSFPVLWVTKFNLYFISISLPFSLTLFKFSCQFDFNAASRPSRKTRLD